MQPLIRNRFVEEVLPIIQQAMGMVSHIKAQVTDVSDCSNKVIAAAPKGDQERAKTAVPAIMAAAAQNGYDMSKPVDRAQVAYMMATAEWESGFNGSVREGWNPGAGKGHVPAQLTYDAAGNHLGNDVYAPPASDTHRTGGDGYTYRGAGYTQITGKSNYLNWAQKLGITNIEDDAGQLATQENAAKILAQGMKEGSFRHLRLAPTPEHPHGQSVPASLDQYINAQSTDFEGARNIINGDGNKVTARSGKQTHGQYIADRARVYQNALDGCG